MNEGSKAEFGNDVSRMGSRLSDAEAGLGGGLRNFQTGLGAGERRDGKAVGTSGLHGSEDGGLFEMEEEFRVAVGARAEQT